MEQQLRTISTCEHSFALGKKCRQCGIYQYEEEAIKSAYYANVLHFSPQQYLSSLRVSKHPLIEGKQIKKSTWEQISALCIKFQFSQETLALAFFIYQKTRGQHPCQKFWSTVALMVAAKAVELDRNIPYLDRYQRHADRTFSQLEYEQAQRSMFESMNFQVHFSTFITFLDFYLTCGVVFKEQVKGKEYTILGVEEQIKRQSNNLLKKGNFTRQDPELTALALIRQSRIKSGLEGWNSHLETLTGYSQFSIPSVGTDFVVLRELSGNGSFSNCYIKGASQHYEHILKSCDRTKLPRYSSISKSSIKQNALVRTSLTHRQSEGCLSLRNSMTNRATK